jgi:hypothetical protein
LDPFVLLDKAAAQGTISPALAKKIRSKTAALEGAVKRVERAADLRYPPYYVEPSLPLAATSVEYGSVGALFARVIPAVFEGRLSILVQFTAPLMLFGLKGTVEAVAAHEFTHYVDLVRRFSRMQVTSDERVSTLFEAEYADEERVVNPSRIFLNDKPLAALVKRKFKAGLVDVKLNEKVAGSWIEKGLPTRRVSTEENTVSVSVGAIARAAFDPMLLMKIEELERSAGGVKSVR